MEPTSTPLGDQTLAKVIQNATITATVTCSQSHSVTDILQDRCDSWLAGCHLSFSLLQDIMRCHGT